MTDAGDIKVHTVFSAEQVERLGVRMRVLGFVNVLVAVVWLYVAWQPMYGWIQMRLALGEINIATGGKQGDLTTFAKIMGPNGNAAPGAQQQNGAASGNEADQAATKEQQEKRAAADLARGVLVGAAFGWLGLTTLAGVWLLVAGVASLTNFAAGARRLGLAVLPLSVIAIGVLAWYVWDKYEWYETLMPDWVKPSMLVLLAIAAAAFGAIVNRHGLKLQRWGAILVIFSAAFSVLAIWAAIRWGQMPDDGVNLALYGKVFAVQSAYGWLLLLAMIGLK
jgi:hypothetical protein